MGASPNLIHFKRRYAFQAIVCGYSLKAIAKPKWKPNDPERVFDVEFYAYGDDEQPAEAFILGLSNEDAGRLFGFVDNIASDWPLRRSEGTDWKRLGGPAKGCHEVRLRIWKKLYRLYVRLDGERRRFVLLDGETKSADAALPATVYRRVGRFGNDYMATRCISPPR